MSGPVLDFDAQAASLPAAPPGDTREAPGLGEAIAATFREVRDDQLGSDEMARHNAYQPLIEALGELGFDRRKYETGLYDAAGNRRLARDGADGLVLDYAAIWRDVARLSPEQRKRLGFPDSEAAFEKSWRAERGGRQAVDADISSRGHWTANLAGGLAGGLTDPINLITLPAGGGTATGLKWLGREMLINGLIEAGQQPLIDYERGLQDRAALTGEEKALNVVAAAALPVALYGTGKAVTKGLPALDRAGYRALAPVREAIEGRLEGRQLQKAFEDMVPPELRTPEQVAALQVYQRALDIDEASPFHATHAGYAYNEARIAAAEADLLHGKPRVARPAPSAPRAVRAFDAEARLDFIIDRLEGGDKLVTDSGGLTKFGISSKGNPGVDVARLTRGAAKAIYREKYVAPLDLAGKPDDVATIAVDASINHGPGFAKRLLRVAGDDPAAMIALRRAEYAGLIRENPEKYGRYAEGWENRLRALERELGLREGGAGHMIAGRRIDGEDADGAQLRLFDEDMAEMPRIDVARSADEWLGDIEAGAPAPLLRRDDGMDVNTWRVAQSALEAEALGLSEPLVTRQTIWEDARDRLMTAKAGEEAGALFHPEVGPIDVIWGEAGDAARKFKGGKGLAHIDAKHGHEGVLDDLAERIEGMVPVESGHSRGREHIVLAGPRGRAVIATNMEGADKRWLLTAYDPNWRPPPGKSHPRMPIDGEPGSVHRGGDADIGDFAGGGKDGGGLAPGARQLELFDDPAGPRAALQAEGLLHDVRRQVEAGELDGVQFATGPDGRVEDARSMLDRLDADEKALKALRGCL